jgi:hypothetical protein
MRDAASVGSRLDGMSPVSRGYDWDRQLERIAIRQFRCKSGLQPGG